LTGSLASEGRVPVEESTVLLPHPAKVRLRNKKMLIVETKKDVGFLIIISPGDGSNLNTALSISPEPR